VLQPLMKPFQNLGKLFLTFLLVFPEWYWIFLFP
jgi:hypothetical protein